MHPLVATLTTLFAGCLVDTDLYERKLAEILDTDQDGYRDVAEGGDDCDDAAELIHPGAVEVPYDGVDQDCDGADLTDADGDGAIGDRAGGDDCDDGDAAVYPGAEDTCYDGIDGDCSGGDDDDCDGDGQASDEAGGTDCDDADPTIWAGAEESWNDLTVDNDCDLRLDDPVASPVEAVGTEVAPPTGSTGFGADLGLVPDLDEDGLAELWVSAPDDSATNGAVFLVRSASLEPGTAMSLAGPALVGSAAAALGSGVDAADLDVDGVEEMVIGALGVSGGEGAVFVLATEELLAESGDPESVAVATFAGEPGAWLGSEVHATDLDGDGQDDLLLTAAGAGVFVFFSPGLVDHSLTDADVHWEPQDGAFLTVEVPGDVDGDGLPDVGVEQGLTADGQVGAALMPAAALESSEFPGNAPFQYLGTPEFGPFLETPWGDRVQTLVQFQVSVYVDPVPGTYDALADADWEVYSTEADGGFADVLWVPGLGEAGPAFLLLAPYSPAGSELGSCIVWAEADWYGSVVSADLPLSLTGATAGDRVCRSATVYEDIDADGSSDLVVSGDGAGPENEGRAWLVLAP